MTARLRVGAAAGARPAAPLVGAEAERSQQIALRPPDQIDARRQWALQPLFEREPPRKASRRSSPRHGLVFSPRRQIEPGDDAFLRSRDAPSHPSLAHPTKKHVKAKPRKATTTPPLKRREAGRREARTGSRIEKRCGARPFSCPPFAEDRGPGLHKALDLLERARSPCGALPRHSPRFYSRLGFRPRFLEPPDANGRTLSGTSAASTSRSGTRRTGRCPSRPRAQCISAQHENRPRSASRSTLAKGALCERDSRYVTAMGTKVKASVALLGTRRRAD